MSQAVTLLRIGTTVRVNVDQVKDRISASLLQQLRQDPRGRVVDYKMTDGGGIGLILEFRDSNRSWFFENEVSR